MKVFTEEELKKSICPLSMMSSVCDNCHINCHFCQQEYVEGGPCGNVDYYYCLLSDVLEHYINEEERNW